MPRLVNIFCNGCIVNSLGFASHMISVATIQLYCYCVKAAIDDVETNEHECVSINLYLQKKKWPPLCVLCGHKCQLGHCSCGFSALAGPFLVQQTGCTRLEEASFKAKAPDTPLPPEASRPGSLEQLKSSHLLLTPLPTSCSPPTPLDHHTSCHGHTRASLTGIC